MTANHIRLEGISHTLCHYHTVQEHGRLGNLCLLQCLGIALEHDVGQTETKYLVGLLHHLLCHFIALVQVLAHTSELCSLTGKYKCFHNRMFLFNFSDLQMVVFGRTTPYNINISDKDTEKRALTQK